jgi:tetratricopeptide (TPR) repeat protein
LDRVRRHARNKGWLDRDVSCSQYEANFVLIRNRVRSEPGKLPVFGERSGSIFRREQLLGLRLELIHRSGLPGEPAAAKYRYQYEANHWGTTHYTFSMLQAALGLWMWAGAASQTHEQGVALYKQHKYLEAIAALEDASKSEAPGTAQYRESALLIGQCYFMLSRAPQAIPWLEKVPDVNEANYILGYAYLQNGQQEQSVAAFARLFGVKADSAAGRLIAGQMMLKKEFEPQALVEINKALVLDPKLPQAHFLLGEVAIFRGRLDEAVGHFEKELVLNPNFAMAWYRLGDAYTRQEAYDRAIPNLQRAVWLNPDYSGPYILLGRCYFKQKNLDNAEGILRRALALDPNNYSANYLLGQTLIAKGKSDEGRAVLEKLKSLRKNP